MPIQVRPRDELACSCVGRCEYRLDQRFKTDAKATGPREWVGVAFVPQSSVAIAFAGSPLFWVVWAASGTGANEHDEGSRGPFALLVPAERRVLLLPHFAETGGNVGTVKHRAPSG